MVNHRCAGSLQDSYQLLLYIFFFLGSTSGFGKRLVLSVLARGDRVIATGRNTEKLGQLVSSVKSELIADNIRTIQLDVTEDEQEIKLKIDQAVGFWGQIHVLVNNAGVVFLSQYYLVVVDINGPGFGLLGILEESGYDRSSRNLVSLPVLKVYPVPDIYVGNLKQISLV